MKLSRGPAWHPLRQVTGRGDTLEPGTHSPISFFGAAVGKLGLFSPPRRTPLPPARGLGSLGPWGGKGEKEPLGWLGMRPPRSRSPASILATRGRARRRGEVAGRADGRAPLAREGPPGAPSRRRAGKVEAHRAPPSPLGSRVPRGDPHQVPESVATQDRGWGWGAAPPDRDRDRGGQFTPGGRQRHAELGVRLASSFPAPRPDPQGSGRSQAALPPPLLQTPAPGKTGHPIQPGEPPDRGLPPPRLSLRGWCRSPIEPARKADRAQHPGGSCLREAATWEGRGLAVGRGRRPSPGTWAAKGAAPS